MVLLPSLLIEIISTYKSNHSFINIIQFHFFINFKYNQYNYNKQTSYYLNKNQF
jgi:hypothetical protein